VARYRIYVYRNRELRCLPIDYETPEDAQFVFEKHRGNTPWCLIGEVDSHTERPTYILHGQADAARQVRWQQVPSKRPG
jgi:hypothetical protein